MKKILILVSGVMLSASVFAAAVDLTPGGANGSISSASKTGTVGTNPVKCDALSTETDGDTTVTPNIPPAPVKVGLSKENIGAIDCNTTDIGVSVASTKGKGKYYYLGSGGGSEAEGLCGGTANTTCINTDAQGGATAALTAAGS